MFGPPSDQVQSQWLHPLPHEETGFIKMVHFCRLLDPIGFQNAMGGTSADLVGAPIEAQVTGWYTTVTLAADIIVPEFPLQC